MLIQGEKQERNEGYQMRIEGLQMLLKQKRTLREVYEKKNKKLEDINKFINDSLNEEYKLEDSHIDCTIF